MEDFRQHWLIDDDQRRLTNAYAQDNQNNALILLGILSAEVKGSDEQQRTADSRAIEYAQFMR
jgi:hypothetical protein